MRACINKLMSKKALSWLLVASFVVSMFAGIPKEVKAADVVSTLAFNTSGGVNSVESVPAGKKLTFPAADQSMQGLYYSKTPDWIYVKDGFYMEFADISCVETANSNYSLYVALGVKGSGGWDGNPGYETTTCAYVLWYGSDGKVAILKYPYNSNTATVVSTTTLDSIAGLDGRPLSLYVKSTQNGSGNYDWTMVVNGTWETTIPNVNAEENGMFSVYGNNAATFSQQVQMGIGALRGISSSYEAGSTLNFKNQTWNENGRGCEVSCTISKFFTGYVPVESVTLSSSKRTMMVDETITLEATVLPANASETVRWESSNEDVATVANGTVTAKQAGTAVITAWAGRYKKAEFAVTVVDGQPVGAPTKSLFKNATYVTDDGANGVVVNLKEWNYDNLKNASTPKLDSGARVDIEPISVPQNTSIQLVLGYEDEWNDILNPQEDACYIVSYGQNGVLTVEGVLTPNDNTIVSLGKEQMPSIEQVSKISVYAKIAIATGNTLIVVDVYDLQGKLCQRYQTEVSPVTSANEWASAIGFIAGRTPDYETGLTPTFGAASDVKFRVSYVHAAKAFEVGSDDNNVTNVPVYLGEGAALPTGYLKADGQMKYINSWKKAGTVYTVCPADTTGLTPEYVDCKMLDIKLQNAQQTNDAVVENQGKYTVRFLSSVNSLQYKNTGILLSKSETAINAPTEYKAQCSDKQTTNVYRTVKAVMNGQEETVTVGDGVYDSYSQYLFGRVMKNVPAPNDEGTNWLYARAYVTLQDGTVVYGEPRSFELQQ